MKEKLKKALLFIANPRLLLCFGIGWIITNGWSYIAFVLGTRFELPWLTAIATGYLAFLWFPFSPEKLVTVAIAMVLLRYLFPNDQKTLGVLREMKEKYAKAWQARKQKREAARRDSQCSAATESSEQSSE